MTTVTPAGPEKESSAEIPSLPRPLVLLDDTRLGLEVWGQSKGIRVNSGDDLEDRSFWAFITRRYWGYLKNIYPEIVILDARNISHHISLLITDELTKERGLLPIFLDSRIGKEHPLFNTSRLDLCRITDNVGTDLGLGNRPGTPPIEEQLQKLIKYYREESYDGVMLIDDIIGPNAVTTLHARNLLAEYGIRTQGVIAATAFSGGRKTLEDQGLSLHTNYEKDTRVGGDILNTCDLFPFHPTGGLKGDTIVYGSPTKTRSVSFPYITPFLPKSLYNRKVITVPDKEKLNFGLTFLTESLLIFQHLRKINGRPILIKDFDAPAYRTIMKPDEEVEKEITITILNLCTERTAGLSE